MVRNRNIQSNYVRMASSSENTPRRQRITLPDLALAQLPLDGLYAALELRDHAALLLACSATLRPYTVHKGGLSLYFHLARRRFASESLPALEDCLSKRYAGDAWRLFYERPSGLRHDGLYAEHIPRREFKPSWWRLFRFCPVEVLEPRKKKGESPSSSDLHLRLMGRGLVLILSTRMSPSTVAPSLTLSRLRWDDGM